MFLIKIIIKIEIIRIGIKIISKFLEIVSVTILSPYRATQKLYICSSVNPVSICSLSIIFISEAYPEGESYITSPWQTGHNNTLLHFSYLDSVSTLKNDKKIKVINKIKLITLDFVF